MKNQTSRIVIAGACRTPVSSVLEGRAGGSLSSLTADELLTDCMLETSRRTGVGLSRVDGVFIGTCIHDPKRLNVARVATVLAGLLPEIREKFFAGEYLEKDIVSVSTTIEVPAETVSFNCGSGMIALITAIRSILSKEGVLYIAGGTESMSHGPMQFARSARGSYSQGDMVMKDGVLYDATNPAKVIQVASDTYVVDGMFHGLVCPFTGKHYGVTADWAAQRYGITRTEQDRAAAISHSRARKAVASGYFAPQIVPVKTRGEYSRIVREDEGIKTVTAGDLASLKPYFTRPNEPEGTCYARGDNGTVTVATSSLVSDASVTMLILTLEEAVERGIDPSVEILDYAIVAGDPSYMGVVPILAIQKLWNKWGFNKDSKDVVYVNNAAFEATNLAVQKVLEVPSAQWNPWGDAVALGHPVGASAAIRVGEAVHMLNVLPEYTYAIVSFCVGGGQAVAMLLKKYEV